MIYQKIFYLHEDGVLVMGSDSVKYKELLTDLLVYSFLVQEVRKK